MANLICDVCDQEIQILPLQDDGDCEACSPMAQWERMLDQIEYN